MERRTFSALFLSGLCLLPVCFPRLYVLVEEAKTWSEAQSYCREKFADLASVRNQTEQDQLVAAGAKYHRGHLWTGLYRDKGWRWSVKDEGSNGEGGAEFRKWGPIEPNNQGGNENCAMVQANGEWIDVVCTELAHFTCYEASSFTFVYVSEKKSWTDAQTYCRTHHTDLAIVRDRRDNLVIMKELQGGKSWIGLHRNPWKWSDGTPYSYMNWNKASLSDGSHYYCAHLHNGRWEDHRCDHKWFFLCKTEPEKKKKQQVLRMKVALKDWSVNLEEEADAILVQFHQKLKEHGLTEDMKLTWKKHADGKIFRPEKEEKSKKNVCA